MWEDKVTSRTPREDFVLAPIAVLCGPGCPQEGHRMRLDEPGYNDAPRFAQQRVWALHAVLVMRGMANDLVSHPDVVAILTALADFDGYYDHHSVDSTTFCQLINIRAYLVGYVARRLTAIKTQREEAAYEIGKSVAETRQQQDRNQFQIRRCY